MVEPEVAEDPTDAPDEALPEAPTPAADPEDLDEILEDAHAHLNDLYRGDL